MKAVDMRKSLDSRSVSFASIYFCSEEHDRRADRSENLPLELTQLQTREKVSAAICTIAVKAGDRLCVHVRHLGSEL